MNEIEVNTENYQWLESETYISDNQAYPENFMSKLRSSSIMGINVPSSYGGAGLGRDNTKLLGILRKIGSINLSAGRIFEGHTNALLLIDKYGSEEQKLRYFARALEGILFGVWNSEHPSEPLEINNKLVLTGSKIFCSGASHIAHPIVTAAGKNGQRMIILNIDECNLREDYTYWQPMGMVGSVSCRFDFTGIKIDKNQVLGGAYNYFDEPDFSGGAVRFAAVQLGGLDAAISALVNHLKKLKRTEDPNQIRRMGQLSILQKTGELWLNEAGKAFDNRLKNPEECIYIANMFRTIVRDICEKGLAMCEKSAGLQALLKPHPLESIHRDLSVYLKQPGPDIAMAAIGKTKFNITAE